MKTRLLGMALLALLAGCATVPQDARNQLAPSGTLRAAINYGNSVLVQRNAATGELSGISVDLARELGSRLGVPVQLIPYDAAGKVADAARMAAWDVAFLEIDPKRAEDISFTAAYVIIEGGYMVRNASPLKSISQVDADGVRIAVGNKSAYDLYLSRALKHATIVRAPTSPAAMDLFAKDPSLDVAAGVKNPLVDYAAAHPGFRVMDGHFMLIEQAMGTPSGRPAGARYLREFIEEMKASGFVAAAIQRAGQRDATVAPAAGTK